MATYTPFPAIVQEGGAFLCNDPRNQVSMLQARLALFQTPNPNAADPPGASGTATGPTLYDAVLAAIAASTDASIPIWFEYSTVVNINDPIVGELGMSMGLTQATVEALFTLAATLG